MSQIIIRIRDKLMYNYEAYDMHIGFVICDFYAVMSEAVINVG